MLIQFNHASTYEIMASDLSLEDKLAKILSRRYISRKQKAICAGNLLAHGVNVRTRNDVLLRWAAENGFVDLVIAALKRGCDIHVLNGESLICAAVNNHTEVVQYLLESGADPSKREYCAFRICASFGQLDMMKLLLNYPTDVPTDVTARNNFAIKSAYQNEQNEIVRYLAQHYPDIIKQKARATDDRLVLSIIEGYAKLASCQNYDLVASGASTTRVEKPTFH